LLATAKKLDDVAGLALPQTGVNLRAFVHQISNAGKQAKEFTVIINPRIIKKSSDIEKSYEGCFSVPGYKGLVPRHKTITVVYQDITGRLFTKEIRNPFLSRVFQHETGHLYKELYFQKMDPTDQLIPRKP